MVTGNEDVVCGDCVPVALGAVLERLRTVSGSGTPEASDVGIGPGIYVVHECEIFTSKGFPLDFDS